LLIAVLGAAQQGRHRRGILAELANSISRREPFGGSAVSGYALTSRAWETILATP
jgi:hypothetical protein